jgi:hypothetical protein
MTTQGKNYTLAILPYTFKRDFVISLYNLQIKGQYRRLKLQALFHQSHFLVSRASTFLYVY